MSSQPGSAAVPPAGAGPARGPSRLQADLALAAVCFIWGSTFVLVKNALADCSTLLFLAIRFSLAAVMLGWLARRVRWERHLLAGSLVVGACMFAGYMFQTTGLRLTSPSKSAFITSISVVLVPVFSGIFFRRFPGVQAAAGVLVATVGMYLLTAPAAGEPVNRGDLLTLCCAVAFAFHILFVGHYTRAVSPMGLTAGQVAVTAALSLASFPLAEQPFVRVSSRLAIAVLVTAVLATAVAFFVQAWAQQYTTPTHTALIFSLEPVFASLASWVAAGEVLGGRAAAGALLILAGIVLAEVRLTGRRRAPAS